MHLSSRTLTTIAFHKSNLIFLRVMACFHCLPLRKKETFIYYFYRKHGGSVVIADFVLFYFGFIFYFGTNTTNRKLHLST